MCRSENSASRRSGAAAPIRQTRHRANGAGTGTILVDTLAAHADLELEFGIPTGPSGWRWFCVLSPRGVYWCPHQFVSKSQDFATLSLSLSLSLSLFRVLSPLSLIPLPSLFVSQYNPIPRRPCSATGVPIRKLADPSHPGCITSGAPKEGPGALTPLSRKSAPLSLHSRLLLPLLLSRREPEIANRFIGRHAKTL
jgi:hypothetical protein